MGVQLKKNAIDLGIVTTQGPAMLAFYRDLLGLKYLREMAMPGGGGTMHQLGCGDSVIKIVVVPSSPTSAAPGGIGGGTGIRYWTMSVTNLSEMVAACTAAGHTMAWTEREIRPGVKVAIVEDPDGNWVEFLQVG